MCGRMSLLLLIMFSSLSLAVFSRQSSTTCSFTFPSSYTSHGKGFRLIRSLGLSTPSRIFSVSSASSLTKKELEEFNKKKKKIYVIVESPAKARTLSKFLPTNYIVDSCVGHIRDLGKKSSLPLKYSSKYVIPQLNLR